MTTQRLPPSALRDVILILWGEGFAEAEAVLFATGLRAVGLCVKVVGLTSQCATGRYGVTLSPDLTLGQALPLARGAICVVAPCGVAAIKRADNDPRLFELFKQAHANRAQFVVSRADIAQKSSLHALAIPPEALICYSEREDVAGLARELAASLRAVQQTGVAA